MQKNFEIMLRKVSRNQYSIAKNKNFMHRHHETIKIKIMFYDGCNLMPSAHDGVLI